MGEASRRKKLDPNFGKRAKNQLEVKLDQDLVLPENLEKVKQALSAKGENFLVGTVTLNSGCYPAVFVPYTKRHQGKSKLYSHVCLSPEHHPEIKQSLIDEISREVCRQILERV